MQTATKIERRCNVKNDPHERAARAHHEAEKALEKLCKAVSETPEGKGRATAMAGKRYTIEQKLREILTLAGIAAPTGGG